MLVEVAVETVDQLFHQNPSIQNLQYLQLGHLQTLTNLKLFTDKVPVANASMTKRLNAIAVICGSFRTVSYCLKCRSLYRNLNRSESTVAPTFQSE